MTRPLAGLQAQAHYESPVGTLTAAATERGIALLSFDSPEFGDLPVAPGQRWLAQLGRELASFWQDPSQPFTVPLDMQGTAFQRAVWQALVGIPSGQTRSYADIAHQVGRPKAMRAVGAANRANPVAIVVPCHRVIGRDGTLTGYAGGLARKATLLRHESAQQALPA
ncbi:MAG: methylated-DNA--[protein]-cysteine S-methyltransferase [Rubrivivax sp.]|nr:methylated-DNA--[protein]-cysteine S-methyltransferase [Rubrivivax sp.]MDH5339472.1 methylated-DNA--[protein]-cysteine S-methyltransferase [Rubrivivax sp.]